MKTHPPCFRPAWACLLLAVAAVISGCKSPPQWDPSTDRGDARPGDGGGSGGRGGSSSGGPGTGGSGVVAPTSGEAPPFFDAAPTVDAPDDSPAAATDAGEMVTPVPTCVPNNPCSDGIAPCRQGATTCATPTAQPVCSDVGADDSRGGCAGGQVCNGGKCTAPCASSVPCTQGIKPCRKGATTCATPLSPSACADVGVDDSKGGCSGGQVCSNGTCVAPCAPNIACTQGLGPCRRGRTSCATPTARAECQDVGADDSRGGCASGNMCSNGRCVAPPPPAPTPMPPPAPAPVTCDGQPIGSGRCVGTVHQTCGGNGQWAPDNSTECRRADGGQCGTGSDCRSGNCSAGICCDSACTGTCQSCSGADTGRANGNCAPVRAGADPRNQCAASSESSCGTDGACNGAGACRLHGTNVTCAQPTCSNNSATPARKCNGSGSCATGNPTSCGAFGCAGTQCATECPKGSELQGTQCQPCGADGQRCCTKGNTCNNLSRLICRANTNTCGVCGLLGDACCGAQRTLPDGAFATDKGICHDPSSPVCELSMGTSQGYFCGPE